MFSVPKVQGARANRRPIPLESMAMMLAYVEIHNPTLILLLSTKDLSEIRCSNAVPFTDAVYSCKFDGFDDVAIQPYKLHVSSVVMSLVLFALAQRIIKVVSDTSASALTKAVYASLPH